MTTLEEAKRCPKCEQPGEATGHVRPAPRKPGITRGAQLHQIMCRNSRCKWYNTAYYIQINPDGTIPEATLDRDKQFKALPDDGGRTERALADLQHRMEKGEQLETRLR
jgi:hypothetical protein